MGAFHLLEPVLTCVPLLLMESVHTEDTTGPVVPHTVHTAYLNVVLLNISIDIFLSPIGKRPALRVLGIIDIATPLYNIALPVVRVSGHDPYHRFETRNLCELLQRILL